MEHDAAQAILIVEYDPPTRALYRRELSRDYQVYDCAGEGDALDLARAHPLDAVVLEPARPDGRGWSLLAALQSIGARAIPIILCSALDERKRGMELGAAAYLVKPVLPVTLLETLRRVIRSREIRL
jgi:DNA-binding response OmpR family regulator